MNRKIKKIIFYALWALIFLYLYTKFAETKPFGKNSNFRQNNCKNSSKKIKRIVNYKDLSNNKCIEIKTKYFSLKNYVD